MTLAPNVMYTDPIVEVGNYSQADFRGWVPLGFPLNFKGEANADGVLCTTKGDVGFVFVSLAPGASVEKPLSEFNGPDVDPIDFEAWTTNPPVLFGKPMDLVSKGPHALDMDLGKRCVVATFTCAAEGLWWILDVYYVGGSPFATGELTATWHDPTNGHPTREVDIPRIELEWGEYVAFHGPASMPKTHIADAQARIWPFTVVFDAKADPASCYAMATQPVVAEVRGLVSPLAESINADDTYQADFKVSPGMLSAYAQNARRALGSWDAPHLGVAAGSGNTGAQEDQAWSRADLIDEEAGSIWPRYLAACSQAKRPCYFIEKGSTLPNYAYDPDRLVIWDGRAHWHEGMSPERLGNKPPLSAHDRHGWSGPDRQHYLVQNLCAAAAVRGSRALQRLVACHAWLLYYSETTDPAKSTSHAGAARGVGWTSLAMAWIAYATDDPDVAHRVKDIFERRWQLVLSEELHAQGPWDWVTDNRVLAGAPAWMPYQHAIGVYGLDVAGRFFGVSDARVMAKNSARWYVNAAFSREGSQWIDWDFVAINTRNPANPLPPGEFVEGPRAHRTGWFRHEWHPVGLWVAAMSGQAKAIKIYQQFAQEASPAVRARWFPTKI